MNSAVRCMPAMLLSAALAVAAHARAEEPAPPAPATPPETPAPAEKPAAPKYHALTLKDGRELKGTYAGGTLTLYNDAGKPMGTVAVKEDEIAKQEELPWPFAAAEDKGEKPADAGAKRVLHVLTLKDGRELKGVYDKAQGSIQMFASNGKPMGALAVKEEEIAKVEEADWPYPDPAEAGDKPEKKAPAASAEKGVDPEVVKDVQAKALALNSAIGNYDKAMAEKREFGLKYHGAKLPPEEFQRVKQLDLSIKSRVEAGLKRRNECRAAFDTAFEKYEKQGGKKKKRDFVPKY